MTPAEVSALLVAVRAVDDRIADDEARVVAWHAILDPLVTPAHARDALVEHYRRETRVIMPADVNAYCKARRDREREAEERRALTDTADRVPMPPEIKARMDEILRRGR